MVIDRRTITKRRRPLPRRSLLSLQQIEEYLSMTKADVITGFSKRPPQKPERPK
jgi:hypothetical protein